MQTRTAALLLVVAFAVFAIWELIQHVFLMNLPMATYHIVSLTIEFGIVFIIAVVAMRLLRQAREREEKQQALREAVVRTLAQDLRPPLVSLLAELRLLERSGENSLDEHTRELIRQSSARAGVLVGMIEDLVAMEVASERTGTLRRFSLQDLLGAVLPAYSALAKERGVGFEEVMEGELEGACTTPEQTVDVLSVLLDNAIRVTPAGGTVRLAVSHRDGTISFAVTDGAPPRGGRCSLAEVGEGTARGRLGQCQAIAEALGGQAWCEPGETGNTCTFSMPLSEQRR
jgi:signal transduction histidine kinase